MNGLKIRPEVASDAGQIRSVVESAFGQSAEAELVEQLRQLTGAFGLVAIRDEVLVGHVMFSPVSIDSLRDGLAGVGLAPMSVRPDLQSLGIGTALLNAGLQEVRRRGIAVVVVVGHRNYYPRFGFAAASSRGLKCRWPEASESFMVLELVAGALDDKGGQVEYASAFNAF